VTSVLARRVLAIFLVLHGLAHLAGTTDLLSRAADGEAADLLGGATSDPLRLRVLGIAWAFVAVAYVLTAAVIWVGRANWPQLLGGTTLASLALAIVSLSAAVIGVLVDVALLALVAAVLTRERRLA
jgi:hypothetical protein